MSTELLYLTLSAGLTVILWIPYVVVRTNSLGVSDAMGYPENPPSPPAWAKRSERVHMNMVENLAPFAALVLVTHVMGVSTSLTVLGATLFFWARVVHAVVLTAGIPYLRTLSFFVSWVGMVLLFIELVF
ncbi:MAG: MAPEG family protein [Alphaproteobacteria bacterium]